MIHLNIATCKWWFPILFWCGQKHVSNFCKMYLLRSPAEDEKKPRVAELRSRGWRNAIREVRLSGGVRRKTPHESTCTIHILMSDQIRVFPCFLKYNMSTFYRKRRYLPCMEHQVFHDCISPRESKGLSYGGHLNTEVFYGLFTGCLRPFYGLFTGCFRPLTKHLSYSG